MRLSEHEFELSCPPGSGSLIAHLAEHPHLTVSKAQSLSA